MIKRIVILSALATISLNAMEKVVEPAEILEITKENLLLLQESPFLTVVDCYDEDCPPCRQMAPIFVSIAQELKQDYLFAKLKFSDFPDIANKFDIQAIPTFIVIRSGKALGKLTGAMTKEKLQERLLEIIEGTKDFSQLTQDQKNERLADAVKFGDLKETEQLMSAGAELNQKFDKTKLPLIYLALTSIHRSGLDLFKKLLEAGAPLEYEFEGSKKR